MKKKYFLLKILGIASLILVVILYLAFYFLPTLKDLSRKKRALKDMNFKISNFLKTETTFSHPNPKEESLFKSADDALLQRIPEVKSREDFVALFTQVFDYIKQAARKDGVYNLMITSNSSEMELNATTLSTDRNSFEKLMRFSSRRMVEVKKDLGKEEGRKALLNEMGKSDTVETPLFDKLNSHTIFLSFSGDLKSTLNFINHIPWGKYYMRLGSITVAADGIFPYFMVYLKVYYIDQRSHDE